MKQIKKVFSDLISILKNKRIDVASFNINFHDNIIMFKIIGDFEELKEVFNQLHKYTKKESSVLKKIAFAKIKIKIRKEKGD